MCLHHGKYLQNGHDIQQAARRLEVWPSKKFCDAFQHLSVPASLAAFFLLSAALQHCFVLLDRLAHLLDRLSRRLEPIMRLTILACFCFHNHLRPHTGQADAMVMPDYAVRSKVCERGRIFPMVAAMG